MAQIKRLVRPLLTGQPELALIGRMIVIPPVRHVLRAIYLDRSGRAERFSPRWTALSLFELRGDITFSLGGDIYKPRPTPWHEEYPTLWWNDDPETPQVLVEAIETLLPKLAPLDDFEAFYQHLISVKDHAYHLRPYQRVVVEAARGRLDEVRKICRDEFSRWPSKSAEAICALLAENDIAGIVALLHEWEATTVRNLKIEHLWEPTPFPLEAPSLQTGGG